MMTAFSRTARSTPTASMRRTGRATPHPFLQRPGCVTSLSILRRRADALCRGGSMTTVPTRRLISLVQLALLAACGSEPQRSITATLTASHTANFSSWSEPVSLGTTINMPGFNDQQPALSKDGLSLYFASNRPESPGDATLDLNIWVSQRACADESCPWGTQVSLGSTVNSSV